MTPAVAARLASWPAPCSEAQLRDRILAMDAAAAQGRGFALVLAEPGLDHPFGWISAEVPPGGEDFALITYWLGEAWQGRGIMRDAMAEAVALLFTALHGRALRAAVQADNGASRSLLEHLGARWVGPGRIWCPARARDEPCLYYEMTRD